MGKLVELCLKSIIVNECLKMANLTKIKINRTMQRPTVDIHNVQTMNKCKVISSMSSSIKSTNLLLWADWEKR